MSNEDIGQRVDGALNARILGRASRAKKEVEATDGWLNTKLPKSQVTQEAEKAPKADRTGRGRDL